MPEGGELCFNNDYMIYELLITIKIYIINYVSNKNKGLSRIAKITKFYNYF